MFKLNGTEVSGITPDLSSYVAIPLDVFKQNIEQNVRMQPSEQIHNFIIQTLPNGKLRLLDSSEFLTPFENGTILQADTFNITDTNNGNQEKLCDNLEMTSDYQLTNINSVDNNSTIDSNNEITFKCLTCEKQFNTIAKFRKHFATHDYVKKYKCNECMASFNIESNLLLHKATHNRNSLTCPVCNVKFNRAASLKSHLMLHQTDETYSCEECMAEFDHEEELKIHKKSHLKVKEKPNGLVCSYCKLTFENQAEYKEHVSYHVKVKKLVLKSKKSRKTNGNITHPHACKTCGKTFPKCSLLERHERIHSGEKPFPCTLCTRSFNQKGTLKIHLIKHSGSKPFQCTLCPAKFTQKGNLRVHFKHTHTAPPPGQKVYKCTQCTCIFKRVASLNAHMTKTHSETSAETTDDDNMSTLLKQLAELEKQVSAIPPKKDNTEIAVVKEIENSNKSGEESRFVKLTESGVDGNIRRYTVRLKRIGDTRWYRCNYCSKESKKPSDLIRHIRTHTREKPFECNICHSAFSLKSTLTSHLRTHISKRAYRCTVCPKAFSSTRTLNLHLQNHERKAKQALQCNICNITFKSTEAANSHQQHHKTEKNYHPIDNNVVMKQPLVETAEGILPVAAPRSTIPYNLNQSHKEERPHRCHLCNAAFKKNDHLQRHMIIHTGDKKHKCNQCPKTFATASSLREHTLFHAGIKNYGCKICGRRFVTSSLLKRHTLMHSTLKPFICPYCNKKFKNVMHCRKHIKIHKKDVVVQSETPHKEAKIIDLADTLKEQPFSIPNIITTCDIDNNTSINNVESNNNPFMLKKQNTAKKKTAKNDSLLTLHKATENNEVSTGSVIVQGPNVSQEELPQENLQSFNNLTSEELPLNESINLNAIYPQLKLQNTESLLLSTLNEMNSNNILFNIETLNTDLDAQSFQVFNNQMLELPQKNNPAGKSEALLNTDLNSLSVISNETSDVLANTLQLNEEGSLLISGNDVPILCTDCNEIFANFDDFKSHTCFVKNLNSKEKTVTVEDTNNNSKVEGNSSSVKSVKKAVKKTVFECATCKAVFENRKLYIQHLSVHKADGSSNSLNQCTYCTKSFKKPSDLIRHLRTHTGEKPFACEKCEKKFTLKSTLESHYRTHDPVQHKKYKCEICNTFFSTKSSLKVHLYIHTGTKPHQCNFCQMKFRTIAHKRVHEENQHSGKKTTPNKPKVMDILLASVLPEASSNNKEPKQTNSVLIKNLHNQEQKLDEISTAIAEIPLVQNTNDLIQEFTGTIPLEITLDQLQSSNILLQDNLTIDANNLIQLDDNIIIGIKNISDNLNYNENVGNVISIPEQTCNADKLVRNHECNICHKKYVSKDVLKKHEKTHGINKKFPCSKCDKGFSNKLELEFHLKQHAGYRLYSCILCNNSFSQEAGLKTHIKRIHPDFGLNDIIS